MSNTNNAASTSPSEGRKKLWVVIGIAVLTVLVIGGAVIGGLLISGTLSSQVRTPNERA